MHDLREQLANYLDDVVPAVDRQDLVEMVTTRLPVEPIVAANRPSRLPTWVYSVAAAAIVLLAIGGVTMLSRSTGGTPTDTPTTTAETTSPTTTAAVPDPESLAEVDVLVPLPVIAEAMTPSSIGAAMWTVYDGVWTDEFEAGLDSAAGSSEAPQPQPPTPNLPESIFLADGIVVDVRDDFLGGTEGLALHSWSFRVDWAATAALHGDAEIKEAEADVDGEVGEVVNEETGEVDILLFASAAEKQNYLDSARHGSDGLPTDTTTPFELIGQYRFVANEDDGHWTLEAYDRVTSDRIGTITTVFPLVDGRYAEGIVTLSSPDSVAIAEPDWLEEAARNGYNWISLDLGDSLLLYVEGDGSTYEAWQSTNGTDWENLGPRFPEGYRPQIEGNADSGWVAYLDDDTESNAPGPDFIHAFSSDGLNWTINDDLPENCANNYRLTAGWVCTSDLIDEFTLDVWTSPDGLTWDQVITTELPSPAGLGGTSYGSTSRQVGDDTIIIRVTTDGKPETRVWLIQFP